MCRGETNIRRLALAAVLLWAPVGCSDAGRDSDAQAPATVQAPGTAAVPHPAEPPTADPAAAAPDPAETAAQIARSAASDVAREPNEVDWSHGNPTRGQELYTTHCAICHGGAGAGDGIATPSLNPKPRDFRDGRFYLDGNANNQTGEDVDLARVILHGPAAFGGTREMIGLRDALSDRDVRDLIAHIRTLASARPAAPAATPVS